MSIIKGIPVELSDIVREANLIVEVECIESFIEDVLSEVKIRKCQLLRLRRKDLFFA